MVDNVFLEVLDLVKHFGGIRAVDNVTFKVPKHGERIIGIIGPNGAGKTTLINLLTGYLKPDKGRIIYNGINIERLPPEVRAMKGLVRTFQLASTFNMLTVEDNVSLAVYKRAVLGSRSINITALFKQINRFKDVSREVEEILSLFDLTKYRHRYVGELPYGIRRLVELAMAYALKPKILFLDEPFAGLNDLEIGMVSKVLSNLINDNKIGYLVIVEHKITWLRELAQRLLVMHEGKLVADGDPGEVIYSEDVQKIYWGRR